MLTTLSRFRRQIAVLTVLAMVASVLVAAPAAAADEPKADFTATFSACVGAATEDAGFTDVPEGHTNAGDIDCIAYYGITKGTSATTYSPLMSVTREQMALFLTRLAKLVGIETEMMGDDMDSGFTDIGDLSEESQKAIGQIKDLGITKGTSDTTYSPAGNVTRGQMALFIARLMDHMTPMADGKIGLSSTTQYGHTPSDVAKNKDDKDIGTPFETDISGETPKEQYDAVTRLYELGVATGVSDTAYSPSSNITRAAMAGFMAAVMDHSNLRPVGLSIQTDSDQDNPIYGDTEPAVVVSYRSGDDDSMFGAIEDQAIDVFSSASPDKALRKDGTCNFGTDPDDVLGGDLIATGDCVWEESDRTTDEDGNLYVGETDIDAGTTRTFFAWIGESDGEKFDTDRVDEVTVMVAVKKAQESLAADSDINANALNLYGKGQVVDLTADSSVTVTATLRDVDNEDVEREGVSIRVHYRKGGSYTNTHEATLTTDENGMVSYPVTGPDNTSATNDREDIVEFVELKDGKATDRKVELRIHWIEEAPFLASDSIDVPEYVLEGTPSLGIKVHQWDQYGNPYRSHSKQHTNIRVNGTQADGTAGIVDIGTAAGPQTHLVEHHRVNSRGYASWTPRVRVSAEELIKVAVDIRQLARNSSGNPVRVGSETATDTNPGEVANFAAWVNLGTSSAESRKSVVDKLRTTYNDARVLVAANAADGTAPSVGTAGGVLYPDEIDDDGDGGTTPALTDFRAPLDSGNDPFVYSRASDAPSGSNAEWSDGLNDSDDGALDTYQDYGNGVTKTAQGLVAAPDPVALADNNDADNNGDESETVWVVDKANSASTGQYNVDLEGPTYDPGTAVRREAYKKATFFLADTVGTDDGTDTRPELLFSFDDEDIFIDNTKDEGRVIKIEMFRKLLRESVYGSGNEVDVLTYNVDGISTFSVKSNSAD